MPKSALRLPALLLFGIYAIYSCILAPLNKVLISDAVLFETVLWDLCDVFFNLFEVLGIAVAFGLLIYSIFRYGTKKSIPLYILVGGALLFKYVASIIALSIVQGSLDLTANYSSHVLSFFIELAVLAFVVILAHHLVLALQEKNDTLKKAAQTLGQPFTPEGETIPFNKKLFSRKNPLLRSAFWGMIAVGVIRLLAFVIDEVSYHSFFGTAYSAADVLVSLLYCVTHVLLPVFLGYLLALGCIKLWAYQENKK